MGQDTIYAGNNTQSQHKRSCRLHNFAISSTGYDGSGICVHGRTIGIDIDHCIAEGPWIQFIVDRFGAT